MTTQQRVIPRFSPSEASQWFHARLGLLTRWTDRHHAGQADLSFLRDVLPSDGPKKKQEKQCFRHLGGLFREVGSATRDRPITAPQLNTVAFSN